MSHNPDLYDSNYDSWLSDPTTAFDSWVRRRELKKDTMNAYKWMWGVFVRWMEDHSLTLATVRTGELKGYIEEGQYLEYSHSPRNKPASGQERSLYPYHMLKLIEAAYDYANGLPGAQAHANNPAQGALLDHVKTGKNRPPAFFSKEECDRLARYVREGKKDDECKAASSMREVEWKLPRDQALVGVLLGGGLKLSEALSLTIRCIKGDSIEIPHSPKTRGGGREGDEGVGTFARTVLLEPFAAAAVTRWMDIRAGMHDLKEDKLFPSRLAGNALDVSNANRRLKQVLDQCNVTFGKESRGSSQTLRNCHAANLFYLGRDEAEIQQQMGWVDPLSVQRFRVHLPKDFQP